MTADARSEDIRTRRARRAAALAVEQSLATAEPRKRAADCKSAAEARTERDAAERIGYAALTPAALRVANRAALSAAYRYPGLDTAAIVENALALVARWLGRLPVDVRADIVQAADGRIYRAAERRARWAASHMPTGRGSMPYVADGERVEGSPRFAYMVGLDANGRPVGPGENGAGMAAPSPKPRPQWLVQRERDAARLITDSLAGRADGSDVLALALALADAAATGAWSHGCDDRAECAAHACETTHPDTEQPIHTAARCAARYRLIGGTVSWAWVAQGMAYLGVPMAATTARTAVQRALAAARRADTLRAATARRMAHTARVESFMALATQSRTARAKAERASAQAAARRASLYGRGTGTVTYGHAAEESWQYDSSCECRPCGDTRERASERKARAIMASAARAVAYGSRPEGWNSPTTASERAAVQREADALRQTVAAILPWDGIAPAQFDHVERTVWDDLDGWVTV